MAEYGRTKGKLPVIERFVPSMKPNLITHNIHGLNDPTSISKERVFLKDLIPKLDVVMLQEHNLRGSMWIFYFIFYFYLGGGRDFSMTEHPYDKSNDCNRV